MATLGFGVIVYIVFTQAQRFTGGPSGLTGIPSLSIMGFALDTPGRLYFLIWPQWDCCCCSAPTWWTPRVGRRCGPA